MRTPRQLLLEHHRHAQDRLDGVRAEVVAGLGRSPQQEAPPSSLGNGFLAACWEELFVCCRRYWAGLGTAWVALLLFAAVGAGGNGEPARTARASTPMLEAMKVQRQLRAELLGATADETPASSPGFGPRSEALREERFA
jgi:hypothetical protein